jgi:hypothetical protein
LTRRTAAAVASHAIAAALAGCGSSSPSQPSPTVGGWTAPALVAQVRALANSPRVAAGGTEVYVTWGNRTRASLATVRLVGGRWGTPEIVTDDVGVDVSLAADLAGNAMVTWIAPQRGGDNVWCLWSAATVPRVGWRGHRIVACDVGRGHVALGPSGDAVVAWTTRPAYALMVSRYHPTLGWKEEEALTSGDTSDPLVDVAVDSTGAALVTWDERPLQNGETSVSVGRAERDGAWVIRRVAELFPGQGGPQAAFEADGLGVVAWKGGTGRGIYAARVSPTAATTVEITGNGNDNCPGVAGSPAGASVIAWSRPRIEPGVFAAAGTPGSWETVTVAPNQTLPAWCPDVAMDATGNAVVAWEQGVAGVMPEVWASARSATSGRWSEPVRLAVGAAHPSVAIANDVAYVVWATETGDAIWESRVRLEP